MFRKAMDQFGAVDILVNCAGVNYEQRSVADISPEAWDATVAINLTGTFNCVRCILPTMRQRKRGFIVNIASVAGVRANVVAGAAYSASKHGVVSLTMSINQEEGKHGIGASVICPGEVNTKMMDLRPNGVGKERRRAMLLPADVAGAVLYAAGLPSRVRVPLMVMVPSYQEFR